MTIRVGLMGAMLDERSPSEVRRALGEFEASGLDHVGVGDHVSFYTGFGMDGLVRSAQYFGASETLRVNTAVYLLPLRHPVPVARQIAELAAMAPGRFTFGVGIGGEDRHEVEICGVDPATRGRRMDECMEVVRGLLASDAVSYEGEFFQLEEARIVPSPSPAVPIVVGGRSDAAIRRAGRFGDGWFGIWVSARRYAEVISTVEQHAVEAGRVDLDWSHALNVWCGVGADPDDGRRHVAPAMERFYQLPFDRFAKWSPVGTATDIADFLAPYVAAGCTTINLILQAESPAAGLDGAAIIRQSLVAG